jgi:hypothetical protein
MLCSILALLLAQLAGRAAANVEKIVFLAPDPSTMPSASPNLDSLCLEPLAPSTSTLHKLLPVRFPSKQHPHGRQSWYLLRGLRPGRRYEVRVCWAASVSAETPGSRRRADRRSNQRHSGSPRTPYPTRSMMRTSSPSLVRTRRNANRAAANRRVAPTATIIPPRCSSSQSMPRRTTTRRTRRS